MCIRDRMKAGGIAVATMPLLRAKELKQIVVKAKIRHALCLSLIHISEPTRPY